MLYWEFTKFLACNMYHSGGHLLNPLPVMCTLVVGILLNPDPLPVTCTPGGGHLLNPLPVTCTLIVGIYKIP